MKTVLVGVDGAGGSGKSTYPATLSDKIVPMDDFVTGPWQWFDFDRVRRDVVEPLLRGEPARYQRLDWNDGQLKEWRVVEPGGVVVIEGVGALDRRLRDAYDQRVWVETPREICVRRGLERDGAHALPLRDAADLIVDGSGG